MTGIFSVLLYMLMSGFQTFIIYRFRKAFWEQLEKHFFSYIGWVVYFLFLLCCYWMPGIPPQVKLAGNFLIVFFISILYTHGNVWRKVIFSLLICTWWMLMEIIVFPLLKGSGLEGEHLRIAGTLITELCMFVFAEVMGRCLPGNIRQELPGKKFLLLLFIPVGSIYFMHQIFLISNRYPEYRLFAMTASILFLLITGMVFVLYDWLVRDVVLGEKNRLYEQQLELCSRQAEEKERLYLEQRLLRHDMKKHFMGILGMVQAGNMRDATEYIEELLNDGIMGGAKGIAHSGNIVVDSLINHYYELARRQEIILEADIFLPTELPFRKGHLAIIFGNLLENALEACCDGKGGEKNIRLETSYVKGILFLAIHNSCPKGRKKDRYGRMHSTKKSPGHGLGLAVVEQAAAFYQGQLHIADNGGDFLVSVVLYGHTGKNDV